MSLRFDLSPLFLYSIWSFQTPKPTTATIQNPALFTQNHIYNYMSQYIYGEHYMNIYIYIYIYLYTSTFSRHPHEQYICRDWKLCYTVIPTGYIIYYRFVKKIDVTVCSVHLIHKKCHYISAFYNFYWIFFAILLVYVILIKFILKKYNCTLINKYFMKVI